VRDARLAAAAKLAYDQSPSATTYFAMTDAAAVAAKSADAPANPTVAKMVRPDKDGIPTTRPRMTYANVYPDGTLTNLPYNPNLTYSWPCGITSNIPYEYSGFGSGAESCPIEQPLRDQSPGNPGWQIDYGLHFGG
jgi:hypothetical protein